MPRTKIATTFIFFLANALLVSCGHTEKSPLVGAAALGSADAQAAYTEVEALATMLNRGSSSIVQVNQLLGEPARYDLTSARWLTTKAGKVYRFETEGDEVSEQNPIVSARIHFKENQPIQLKDLIDAWGPFTLTKNSAPFTLSFQPARMGFDKLQISTLINQSPGEVMQPVQAIHFAQKGKN